MMVKTWMRDTNAVGIDAAAGAMADHGVKHFLLVWVEVDHSWSIRQISLS